MIPSILARRHSTLRTLIGIGFLGWAPQTLTAQQLFVGNDHTPGGILQYNLPITGSSTSNYTIASNNVVAVAVDPSGNLAVGELGGNLQFFTAPLSGASVPSASFPNGTASNNGQIVFTPAGDFFAATVSNRVYMFTHPFSNASTPSSLVTNPALVLAVGVGLDAAQNLYIANEGSGTAINCSSGANTCSNLLVYAPPYTGAPIISTNVPTRAYRKLAISGTQLFVDNVAGGTGTVDVYNLPITGASAPAFSITNGVNIPEGAALDSSGNLYIGNLGNATVSVYSSPFSAGSTPTTTLTVSAGSFSIFGIAIANGCTPDPSTLCLSSGRFRVTAAWRSPTASGAAHAVSLTGDTGYFWFFDPGNVEVTIKVLNGCGITGRYWVFASGLTNVEVTLTVTDTLNGMTRTYVNPINVAFQPIQDTAAFATCP